MHPIKNIIFDLGGIFMNIDFKKTEQAFIDLGITQFPDMFNQHFAKHLFEDLETGKINPDQFYEAFRQGTGTTLSNTQIKDAWNALLLDFPEERLVWLEELSTRYKLFLYSNTNQIHYEGFMDILQKENDRSQFNYLFSKAYYSHELGLRKPYPASFQYILKEQNLNPSETLFIDDTLGNIEGAKEAGLQTIHLVAPRTVLDLGL